MIPILAFIDSTLLPVDRPVDIHVDDRNQVYVLSINGRIYLYPTLLDSPIVLIDNLEQPSSEMEFVGDTIYVMHGRFLQSFWNDTGRVLLDFIPIMSESNTFDIDTIRKRIYVAIGSRWPILDGGRIFRINYDGKNMYNMATGLKAPVCMDVDSRGIPWVISHLDGDMYGLYPVYEGMNYTNLVPSIYLRDEPSDIIALERGFLISFRNGNIVYFRRVGKGMYERDSVGRFPIEISSIFLKGDTLYMSDYSGGRIYRSILEVDRWKRNFGRFRKR